MLRVAALLAAVVAWGALPGADDPESTPDEVFRWTSAPAPGSDVETRNATADAPPTVLLRRGRIAVAAHGGDRDQQVLIEAGPMAITVTSGQVLVDHVDGTCFVVVVVGSALVRGMHSQHRGILLQSRQGIASAADGALADVLTFERVPRLNDPEPLAQQASAAARLAAHDEPWPDEVPLLAAHLPEVPAPITEQFAQHVDGYMAERVAETGAKSTVAPVAATAVLPTSLPDSDHAAVPRATAVGDTATANTSDGVADSRFADATFNPAADEPIHAATPTASRPVVPAWQRRGRR